MTTTPMTTQQWQDWKFGRSYRRTAKWLAVDIFGVQRTIATKITPVFAAAADAFKAFADAYAGEGYRNAAHARSMAERILPGVELRDEETDRG